MLSFSILGSNPEHGHVAKFESKQECYQALKSKVEQEQQKGRLIVATCNYKRVAGQGWW